MRQGIYLILSGVGVNECGPSHHLNVSKSAEVVIINWLNDRPRNDQGTKSRLHPQTPGASRVAHLGRAHAPMACQWHRAGLAMLLAQNGYPSTSFSGAELRVEKILRVGAVIQKT